MAQQQPSPQQEASHNMTRAAASSVSLYEKTMGASESSLLNLVSEDLFKCSHRCSCGAPLQTEKWVHTSGNTSPHPNSRIIICRYVWDFWTHVFGDTSLQANKFCKTLQSFEWQAYCTVVATRIWEIRACCFWPECVENGYSLNGNTFTLQYSFGKKKKKDENVVLHLLLHLLILSSCRYVYLLELRNSFQQF